MSLFKKKAIINTVLQKIVFKRIKTNDNVCGTCLGCWHEIIGLCREINHRSYCAPKETKYFYNIGAVYDKET